MRGNALAVLYKARRRTKRNALLDIETGSVEPKPRKLVVDFEIPSVEGYAKRKVLIPTTALDCGVLRAVRHARTRRDSPRGYVACDVWGTGTTGPRRFTPGKQNMKDAPVVRGTAPAPTLLSPTPFVRPTNARALPPSRSSERAIGWLQEHLGSRPSSRPNAVLSSCSGREKPRAPVDLQHVAQDESLDIMVSVYKCALNGAGRYKSIPKHTTATREPSQYLWVAVVHLQ